MTRIRVYILNEYENRNKTNKYLYIMNKNKTYQTPVVLQEVNVLLEREFLAASIVDQSLKIYSDGQEVEEVDAASTDFDWNSSWEWE